MQRLVQCIVLLAFIAIPANGQSSVSSKQKQLDDLRNSIRQTQQKLDALQRSERSAKKNLSTYSSQRRRITAAIQDLRNELTVLNDSAAVLLGHISLAAAELAHVTATHSSAINDLLRYRSAHKGDMHTSETVSPLFRSLLTSVEHHRIEMAAIRDSLSAQHSLLSKYTAAQATTLTAKARQEQSLTRNIRLSTKELGEIRKDKQQVAKELKAKQASVRRLRAIIAKLVAEAQQKARKQKAIPRKKGTAPHAAIPDEPTSGFPANSLPWPTGSRKILHGYGTYRNEQSGTTLDNPGIDISARVGSTVKAVAGGNVSSVTWLPGFGSLVIVDHGNGIRTVYANLASVSVGKGASVNAGSVLGTSGENIDGALVHFEVWSGKNRQNPMRYLK